VGGLLSLAVSAILSVQIFEMAVSFDAGSILGTVLGATGISFLLSLVASWRVIRAKPLLVLQG
jgi:ABC-type antimicrobial peptide transport system permease subunit